jgi:hypothetical protein
MWVFILLHNSNVIEFDVEKLVNGFEDSLDSKVVFELHRDFLVDQRFEEGVEYYQVSVNQESGTYTFRELCLLDLQSAQFQEGFHQTLHSK